MSLSDCKIKACFVLKRSDRFLKNPRGDFQQKNPRGEKSPRGNVKHCYY